ncbi:sigma-70 family RNA polymerase sigma factor [Gemmata sp. JC673]|uniref:Sigma-70 family RNA polymerase sigma factor n=1 Tax=Gemmata algarum TaxID=2975278 RepID=A0ABU5F9J5_9BACT|nr:sigma-70 family RNA polymerase sigma factor [Gemmata algarum]MDY3563768.1 sigma-70 family RNA polymerase sigma factor [Gemmata algarum]
MLEPNRHPPESDEQLLARLRAGERDCFGVLVRRYERELFGYLRRYLGDDDLADDVFQNTFVQVYTKLGQYELDRPVRPWLYAIATNQAIDALRRRNRRADQRADVVTTADEDGHPRPLFELLPAAGDEPSAAADRAEQRELVRAAVDRLPELLRQVVLLAYFQGLKYRDVADALGIPVGTVKSRLHAALAKLTEEWGAAHDGPGEPGVEKNRNDEETGVHLPSSA